MTPEELRTWRKSLKGFPTTGPETRHDARTSRVRASNLLGVASSTYGQMESDKPGSLKIPKAVELLTGLLTTLPVWEFPWIGLHVNVVENPALTAQQLKDYRRDIDFSQRELAKGLGVSKYAVISWEKETSPGKRKPSGHIQVLIMLLISIRETYEARHDELIAEMGWCGARHIARTTSKVWSRGVGLDVPNFLK